MKHGLAVFPTESGLRPAELGLLAEQAGFESLFFPEHSHMPVEFGFPAWDPTGEYIGPEYSRVLDPFVALASAASVTSTIRLGTGVCLLAQRDPIQTAKTVATLDWMSGGRFLFGVAPGWNKEEMENHGYDFRTRFSRLDEYLAAVKRIWANDVAGFEGRYVSFQKIQSWPKPVRSGGPPILIGGGGASALDRVLAWGDEWLAEPAHGLAERMEELASRAVGADRAVNVTIYGAEPGSAAVWRDLGAHRCVYWLTPDDATAQRREIDRLRAVILKD